MKEAISVVNKRVAAVTKDVEKFKHAMGVSTKEAIETATKALEKFKKALGALKAVDENGIICGKTAKDENNQKGE